ncbi:MAG: phosphate ABC transporter permease subunit PstC [Fimbriimonadaceae bacterium]|nr:phosphate ABC transporter permease subunit PstC [Fimbriimonadaceae bacterium]
MAAGRTSENVSSTHNLRRKASGPGVADRAMLSVTFVSAALSIITTIAIVVILFSQSAPFFQQVPVTDFFFGMEWNPASKKYGVVPLAVATLIITIGSACVSVPLGTLVGIYLAEYASPRIRGILKPALELLAGVPTVVYGYFALTTVTPLIKMIFPEAQTFNMLSGAIVVGIMTLPLVSSLCEDAISAVPRSMREGAFAMGSTKFETIRLVVIPSALSGIVASFILAISRAVGEVMAVAMAAGLNPKFTLNPLEGSMTMTAMIVNTSKGDVARGTITYQSIFAVALALFLITLTLNMIANFLVRKYRRGYS